MLKRAKILKLVQMFVVTLCSLAWNIKYINLLEHSQPIHFIDSVGVEDLFRY